MRPLMLGYLSVPDRTDDEQVDAWRAELKASAEREGYYLSNIFVDRRGQSFRGFTALREAVRERSARAVVVPAFEHLAHIPGLATPDARLLSRALGTRLVVAGAENQRPASPAAATFLTRASR